MKTVSFLLATAALIFSIPRVFSVENRQICFDILWETDNNSTGPSGLQDDGAQEFININGNQKVPFYVDRNQSISKSDAGKVMSSHSKGCASSSDLILGKNNLNVQFLLGKGQPMLAGWLRITAVMLLPSGGSFVIGQKLYQPDPSIKFWEFNSSYTASLREIAPDLVSIAEKAKVDIAAEESIFVSTENSYLADKAKYQVIVDSLEGKSFFDISEADLLNYQEALDKLSVAKADIKKKQETIAQKTERLRNTISSAKSMVEAAITKEGIDLNAADLLNLGVSTNLTAFQSLPNVEEKSATLPYKEMAKQTIQELQYFIDQGQRPHFLEKALYWSLQNEKLLAIVNSHSIVSRNEITEFDEATQQVNSYLFGDQAGKTGVITQDFWFRDLGIPTDVRDAIDNDLKSRDPDLARRLKSDINALNALSETLVLQLRAVSELSTMYKAAESENESRIIDKIIQGGVAAIEAAPGIIQCVAKNAAAGPFADYYELVYEKDFCTGQPNEEFDRYAAGASLAIEAGTGLVGTPIGAWAVDKLELPFKFLRKTFSAVHSAAHSKALVKLEKLKGVFASGITVKMIHSAKKISVDIAEAESRFGKTVIGILADEKAVEAASRWGVSKNGMNQLFEHSIGKDASRLSGLERRAGLPDGALSNALSKNSEEIAGAMKQMDDVAADVAKNGTSKVDGLKTTSWKPGIVKSDDGIAVIQYDGKFQSLQPMTGKNFNSL